MPDIHHEIEIEAPVADVYEAVTTQKGLKSFWTDQVKAEPMVGSVAEFRFGRQSETVFRMRIDTLQPDSLVKWHCLGDPDEWKGTTIRWELNQDRKVTRVRFRHLDWRSADGVMPSCNYTWAMVLSRLNDYVTTGTPSPWFTRT